MFDGCTETRILKPVGFPDATLHYALPVHLHSFFLLFSSGAQVIVALYRFSLLSILCTQKESIHCVKEVPFFGHSSYLVQFASEWLLLKDSSLTHIPTTDLVFCDDFTNSGARQFLLVNPSSPHAYSLLSPTLSPLLQDALHAHQHKRPEPSGGGCELVFRRGLGEKQRVLERQIEAMREEVVVMEELGEGHVKRRGFFVPWIGGVDSQRDGDVNTQRDGDVSVQGGGDMNTQEDGDMSEGVKKGENEKKYEEHNIKLFSTERVKEEGGNLWIEDCAAETVLAVIEWNSGVVTCLREPCCVVLEECASHYPLSVLLFARNDERLRFVGRQVLERGNSVGASRFLVKTTEEPLESLERLKHMDAEWIPVSPFIQAISIPVNRTLAFQLEETLHRMNGRTTVRLDVVTTPLMETLLRMLRDALMREILYHKESVSGLTRVKKEGLLLRLKSEALCLKLLSLLGGEDGVKKWKEFMKFSLCRNKQSIVHMYTHSTLLVRANSPPRGEHTWDPSCRREGHQPALHHRACPMCTCHQRHPS